MKLGNFKEFGLFILCVGLGGQLFGVEAIPRAPDEQEFDSAAVDKRIEELHAKILQFLKVRAPFNYYDQGKVLGALELKVGQSTIAEVITLVERHAQGIDGLSIFEAYNTLKGSMGVSVNLWSDDKETRTLTTLTFFFDEHGRLEKYGVSGQNGPLDLMKVIESSGQREDLYKRTPDKVKSS